MNSLIFKKSARIENDVKKNKWVMHFWNMSGDADNYEEDKVEFDNTSKLLEYLIIYSTRWLNPADQYDDTKILAAADAKGIELGMESGDGYDLYQDIVGYDITSQGSLASPEECWVTYFDEFGYEHMVEIINDGNVFYKIGEHNIKEVLK